MVEAGWLTSVKHCDYTWLNCCTSSHTSSATEIVVALAVIAGPASLGATSRFTLHLWRHSGCIAVLGRRDCRHCACNSDVLLLNYTHTHYAMLAYMNN